MFSRLIQTIFFLAIITGFAAVARANTFGVIVTADSGPGSLRQAIINSNLNPAQTGDRNRIVFNIPGNGLKSITLKSPLPAILYPVEIDGTSQNGYGVSPVIEINGMNAGANASGLRVVSGYLIVNGVAINRFRRYGIYVSSPGRLAAMTNCRIGTDVTGTIDLGNGSDGIYLTGGFSDDDSSFIGPDFDEPTAQNFRRNRNVISGNGGNGIRVTNSHRVWIGGNYIGTNANGLQDLGNDENGVLFTGGSGQIGAEKMSDFDGPEGFFMLRNLISGNDQNGIKISDSAREIIVNGNYIGTTATGNEPLRNSQNGVWITTHDADVELGAFFMEFGSGPDGNLISGNGENGVKITGSHVGLANNLIGTNAAGSQAVGNEQHGLLMSSSNNQPGGHNLIGSNGTKNIISGNKGDGIRIDAGANSNRITGNNIGTNISGHAPLGNGGNGVSIFSSDNRVGGTDQPAVINVITANASQGVLVANGSNNWIHNNFIGTIPADENADFGGGGDGIRIINGATATEVAGNKIAYHKGAGITIYRQFVAATPQRNKLIANRIFRNAGIAIDLGNNGPTVNDPGDSDSGPNALQNYPTVTRVDNYITTTLNSLPNKTYRIDLFRTGCTIADFGTQAHPLTSFDILTDGNGHGTFGFAAAAIPGELAATATDPDGNTSELSPCPQQTSSVSFATGPLTVDEAAGTATVTVYRFGNTPMSVNYATTNGTTTASADYAPTSGVLSFNFVEFMKTFTIPIVNDSLDEENETITITLSNPTNGGTITGSNPVTLTIVDNDPPPSLTSSDFGGSEGAAGATVNFVFTVNLSGPSAKTITVDYATNDVTATAGTDYAATSGQLIFQPGETSKTVPVTVFGDGTLEPDETFALALSNVANAVALDNAGTGTIVNDDKVASISFSTGSYSISESGTSAVITVVRTNDLTGSVSVDYAASAGTADSDTDFQAVSGTLTFDEGVTMRKFEVPIISDDINEANETVNLVLANPTGLATISAPSTAVLTILDDDDSGLPSLTISDVSLLEGNNGPADAVFTVTLSDSANVDVTVNYATVDMTALAGQDYEPVADVLTIPAGATSAQIVVKIKGESTVETDETFRVELTNPVNAVFNVSTATGTILNDDADQAERIAFTTNRNGDNEIYLMNLDGSNEVQLTNNVVNDSDPAWSPDRSKIAFVSNRHGHADILIMKPDGTVLASVTNDNPVDGDPVWSPDGMKIAFTRFKAQNQSDVYVVNHDGTNLTPVAIGPRSESEPAWSPDGKFIAFTRDVGGGTEIFVINLLTKTEVKLTSNAANDSSPSWSPDGLRLAFVSDRDGQSHIYTMKINGEGVQQLTFEGVNLDPAYSADGSRIWFTSNRSFISNFEIFSMNADGANQLQLTTNPAADIKPAR